MARISVAASAPGWDSTIRSMKAMPTNLKREVSRQGRTLAEPLAQEIRAEGHRQGGHAASVADTVKSGARSGVPTVSAGGKPFVMGSEYGGGRRRTTYTSTSPRGRRYLVVQRASTRQFRTFKKSGYWFTKAATGRGRDKVLKAWAKLVDDVVRRF